MITLIIGGMNSGKSKYAEDIIRNEYSELPGVYLATMIPYGEFGQAKIAKHRAMREDIGLVTIEDPYLELLDMIHDSSIEVSDELSDETAKNAVTKKVILMEDLSNLIANYMFERKSDYTRALDRLIELGQRDEIIIVALKLDEHDESQGYDESTIRYIKEMNDAIARISKVAARVVEVGEANEVV